MFIVVSCKSHMLSLSILLCHYMRDVCVTRSPDIDIDVNFHIVARARAASTL